MEDSDSHFLVEDSYATTKPTPYAAALNKSNNAPMQGITYDKALEKAGGFGKNRHYLMK